jgi:hypothetical protein
MTSKYIAWILGIVLVVALGAFVWLWKSQEKAVLAPETSEKTANTLNQEIPVTGETKKSGIQNAESAKSGASLDDIAQNIGADINDDRAAMDDEATSELGSLEEGNTTVNDLGKTYDESAY